MINEWFQFLPSLFIFTTRLLLVDAELSSSLSFCWVDARGDAMLSTSSSPVNARESAPHISTIMLLWGDIWGALFISFSHPPLSWSQAPHSTNLLYPLCASRLHLLSLFVAVAIECSCQHFAMFVIQLYCISNFRVWKVKRSISLLTTFEESLDRDLLFEFHCLLA